MKQTTSIITGLAIYMNIDSYVTVTNPDETTATFSTPSKGKGYEAIKLELELTAKAYIAAMNQTKYESIGDSIKDFELAISAPDMIGETPLS